MNVTVTKDMKRKLHTPSGERWKTVCGKRIGETVPTTTEIPTCKVCKVVYDQSIRGVVRGLKSEIEKFNDERFNFGFALSLILLVQSFPALNESAYEIFQEAGYEIDDFEKISFDPEDRIILNQILGV